MVNAVATLLFSASYLPGTLVLGRSLLQKEGDEDAASRDFKLVLLIACGLTAYERGLIDEVFDEVISIDLIHARYDSHELKLLERPELSPTFTKINLFKLGEFDKVLYLDSDTLPVKKISSLFNDFKDLSKGQVVASPDAGWPDIFNSGVMLLKPSIETYVELLEKIQSSNSPSFDGADQGLLNEFFHLDKRPGNQWIRLPFLYNVTPSGQYQYQPAFKYFEDDVKLVHFIGSNKPWFDVGDKNGLRKNWWDKYHEFYGNNDDIQKTIHGIEPIYYHPEAEKSLQAIEQPEQQQQQQSQPSEPKSEPESEPVNKEADVLLNPQSYQYFETVQPSNQWNPSTEEPPKEGKPEAEHFPKLEYSNNWESNEPHHEPEPEPEQPQYWKPQPIFPWEFEHREFVAERTFDEGPANKFTSWESLPLIRKIKDKQQEEQKAQERARKLAESVDDVSDYDKEKQERLKEIEKRYNGDIAPEPIEQDLMDLEKESDELVESFQKSHLEESQFEENQLEESEETD